MNMAKHSRKFRLSSFRSRLPTLNYTCFELSRLLLLTGSNPLPLPLHCRRIWVLHLDPVSRASGAVARAQPLADDAFEAELAGVTEDDVARLADVLVG
jgi:hypothetical protein